jgi:Arc/MetJ-type ribon-helix-helix transcriptional regulator
MRTKRITTITSFSTTTKMYDAIRRVSHELQINASDLIRQAIEDFLQKQSTNSKTGKEEKGCLGNSRQANTGEGSQNDNFRTA